MSEPTLTDIAGQLQEFKQTTEVQFQDLNRKVDALSQEIKEVKTAVDKLDSRLFELSMRIVTANSWSFFQGGYSLIECSYCFCRG